MSKSATLPAQHSRPTSVPPIVAHIFRPKPVQPKARPQPMVGILAELATIGNY